MINSSISSMPVKKGFTVQTLLAILVIAISFSLAADPDDDTIIVRGHYNYPPFEFLDSSGEPTGFDVEMLKEVAREMDMKIDLHLGPWDEIYNELVDGKIDILIGMYYSVERAKIFDFSIPYETVAYSIFTRKDSPVMNLDGLHGKEIVLVEAGISVDFIKSQNISSKIFTVASHSDALRLLSAGNYDCAIIPKSQGLYIVEEDNFSNVMDVGPQFLPRNLGFAVSMGNSELIEKLNEGIQRVKDSGVHDRLHKKWIESYEEKQIASKELLRLSIWLAAALVFLFLVSLVWVTTLRQRVEKKTSDLLDEINERKRVEEQLFQANRVQEVLYKIANAASGTGNLDELYKIIRETLHEVIDTSNFYIALVDREKEKIVFPYSVDELDDDNSPMEIGSGLTGYLLERNKTMFFTKPEIEKLWEVGLVPKVGTPSELWLGVPLRIDEEVIGAVVVQSYTDQNLYSRKDLDVLEFVSTEIADAIHHKQIQEAVIQSEKEYRVLSGQLSATNRMKELLLDVITHDLKNPAGVIMGMSSLMIEEEPENESLQLINESCSSLLQVIDNAVILSKISLGEDIDRQDVDLTEMISSIAVEFNPALKNSNMQLYFPYSDPLIVPANMIIGEVFKNYISNAIKYSAEGKRIDVEMKTDSDYVTVNFIDFGPTISAENMARVFDRGVRFSDGEKTGRGLGLAIARRIAESHNGEVGVAPNHPQGNIFYLRLPLN